MDIRQALGQAIRLIRKQKGLTQESFDTVSSRTYMSTLERGLKSPTIDKLDEIPRTMEIRLQVGSHSGDVEKPKMRYLN
jgi:transcriptional regulator with XRE-family HTH domain